MACWEDLLIGRRRRAISALMGLVAMFATVACLHHGREEMVAFTQQNKLLIQGNCRTRSRGCWPLKPTDAAEYSADHYDEYKQSGFVTLKPNMQLRIVAPVSRATSAEPQTASDGVSRQGPASQISLPPARGLSGYETAVYSVRQAANGAVLLKLEGISLQPIGKSNAGDLIRTDYLSSVTKALYLRLYFQLRHAPADHPQVLLVGDSQGGLNEASGEFEQTPDAYCAARHTHARCIIFPSSTAVNAEILVYVRKRAVHVPLSGTVSDALVAAGISDPKAVVSKLKIRRTWDARSVNVRFDRESTSILDLALIGGDRISL
jgi:hypothetical protein